MFLKLDDTIIHLASDDPLINRHWRHILIGWPAFPQHGPATPAHIQLRMRLVDSVRPPAKAPLYTDGRPLPEGAGVLSVYPEGAEQVQLHFEEEALLQVPLSGSQLGQPVQISGQITRAALAHGRIEDITFTSLAPLLRRRGSYLIHAFAASIQGQAALIVGPSGSGKTTTGLSLLLAGWRLLSNDALLLRERAGRVYGFPTPGSLSVRANSVRLLPRLRPFLGEAPLTAGRVVLTNQDFTQDIWSEPLPIETIYFPQVAEIAHTHRMPIGRAVSLARLMEESIDMWDETMFSAHVALLTRLSEQAAAFTVQLGQDVKALPGLLGPGKH